MSVPDEATQALGRATDRRAHHQPDDLDAMGGLLTFPHAKQSYYAAGTHVYLDGQQQHAQSEALSALDLFEHGRPDDRSFSDEAGARAELALARVHANQIDGAREALAPSGCTASKPPADPKTARRNDSSRNSDSPQKAASEITYSPTMHGETPFSMQSLTTNGWHSSGAARRSVPDVLTEVQTRACRQPAAAVARQKYSGQCPIRVCPRGLTSIPEHRRHPANDTP